MLEDIIHAHFFFVIKFLSRHYFVPKFFFNDVCYTYHRDDGGSNILELDAALMQCADQQLSVFPSVLMFHIVSLNHFFFQHQYHLHSKKQTIEYKLTSFFFYLSFLFRGESCIQEVFINLIFYHQDLIIILPM